MSIRREFRISPDAQPDRDGEPPHLVHTRLLMEDRVVELETGVRVCSPVSVTTSGCGFLLGRPGQLRITLRSHLEREVRGSLRLVPRTGLEASPPMAEFLLPARSWTDCHFAVQATERGTHRASLRLMAAGLQVDREVPLRALAGSEAVATVDASAERATLESAALRLEGDLRGGRVRVFAGLTERLLATLPAAQLGPPFSEYRVRPDVYRARIEGVGPSSVLVLTRKAVEMEGLELEAYLSFEGPNVVGVRHRLVNHGTEPRQVALRLGSESHLQGYVTYPLAGGLVREPLHGFGHFPTGPTDILPLDSRFAESWCASEDERGVVGQVWQGASDERFSWEGQFPEITYDLGRILPGDSAVTPPLWVIAGPGSWPAVRHWWRRVALPAADEEREPPLPRRVFEIRAEPHPAVLSAQEDVVRLVATNLRGTPVTGRVDLEMRLPGRAGGAAVRPAGFDLPATDRDRWHATTVRLSVPPGPFAGYLHARATVDGQAVIFDVPLLRLGSSGEVLVDYRDGVWTVDNGALAYRAVPAFGGSVTGLVWQGRERLRSAYPEPRPFLWSGRWFGGIHAELGSLGAAHLAHESFAGGPIERPGRDGESWRGVGVSCDLAHRDRRALRLEVDYLTLPGSNVVLILLRWTNRVQARLRVEPAPHLCVWLAPGVSGVTDGHWFRAGRHEVRAGGRWACDMRSESWGAVADPTTGEAALLVPTDREAAVYIEDLAGDGQHLGLRLPMTLEAGETRQATAWLVLCPTAELEAYASLRDYRPQLEVARPPVGEPSLSERLMG